MSTDNANGVTQSGVDPTPAPVPTTRPPQQATTILGFTFGQWIALLTWPLLVFGVGSHYLLAKQGDVDAIVSGVKHRPPLKVMYVSDRLNSLIEEEGLSTDQALTRLQSEVNGLSKAGYIVIDARTVMAAPREVELR